MTRTLYSQTETTPEGDEVTVTVVRTDDYETCEIARDVFPPTRDLPSLAFRVDISINGFAEEDLAYLSQLDAFTQVVNAFEENGIHLN